VAMALRVFCSYSHQDESFRKELEPFLRILERETLIAAWHDRKIEAGADWAIEIDTELNRSDLILLLISASFIQSNYAFDIEMKRAMEMHDMKRARVVPILIRTTPLSGNLPFERLQMIPRDMQAVSSFVDRDKAWTMVVTELRAVAKNMVEQPEVPLKARRALLQSRTPPNEILCIFDKSAVIGRARTCDIAVTRAPEVVGKQHARFFFEKGEFLIDDLESINGTFVDGKRVRMNPLRMGSRVDLGGGLPFTFWKYETTAGPTGALLYTHGDREIARYILAPNRRVGIGTTIHDAVQVPMVADGKTIGVLESSEGLLYYTASQGGETVRLGERAMIDAQAVTFDLRILE
jgi:hypothetical protein